ncbi:MAG TPA: LuxR C-terminal-related transcriptional regulator [Chloroflexota bacterium]|nr:LuxR C-terminal-related transcriptional regulator [Chloroflexota bacterium]
MDRQRVDEHDSAWVQSADDATPLEERRAPNWPPGQERASHAPQLTTRELLALQLVARGYTTTQIARMLDTTASAVDRAIEQAANRVGAAHRAEAVALAIRRGLIA